MKQRNNTVLASWADKSLSLLALLVRHMDALAVVPLVADIALDHHSVEGNINNDMRGKKGRAKEGQEKRRTCHHQGHCKCSRSVAVQPS